MSSHSHHHNHSLNFNRHIFAYIFGIGINLIFAIVELVYGYTRNSMALIADSGHNFLDVIGLVISFAGVLVSLVRPTEKFTYGLRKSTILASLVNSIFLLVSVIFIFKESVSRLASPEITDGKTIMIISGIGVVINSLSGFLFFRLNHNDINTKSAFFHLLSDALVSISVLVAGILIIYTGQFIIDPIVSIIIAFIILVMTWKLLKASFKLSMDGVPEGININTIESTITKIKGIKEVHHTHVWSLSASENAFTAHIVIDSHIIIDDLESLKNYIRQELSKFGISHSTLEFETADENCDDCILTNR